MVRPFLLTSLAFVALLTFAASNAVAQPPKLESCKPVGERTSLEGCWILANTSLGQLSGQSVYWTLDVFADRDSAQAAASPGSTVLDALGKVWLLTVGNTSLLPAKGKRVTQIGPLTIKANEEYTAQYREAIMSPGSVSRTHVHSGPEAFYTESGETCLETPNGREVSRKGHDVIVSEGLPMELVATGSEQRRGLVLVLHASAEPHTTLSNWKSAGFCKTQH